ncbi:MAG: hypothetical protein ACRELD_00160 [Longimicrobiales bacterium]
MGLPSVGARRPCWLASAGLLAALTVAAYSPVAAQQQSCDLGGNPRLLNQQGSLLFISGRFRVTCTDGVVVEADSAVNLQDLREWYLIGDVHYMDQEKTLTAGWVHYQTAQRYLQGRDDVVVSDQQTGSLVRGEQLQYFRQSPERDTARVLVGGGRPHAELRDRTEPGALPDTSAPTLVDANVIELIGDDAFRAFGDVELTRGEIHGTGAEAHYDGVTNRLVLIRDAAVEGEGYDLSADQIEAELTDADRIEQVRALGHGHLISGEADLRAPELRVFFADGVAQRLIALGAARTTAAADSIGQAILTSQALRLVGDSIDATAADQRLDSLYAVGAAYGEQLADSVPADLPAVLHRDWARGDTIRAYFTAVVDSIASAAADSVVTRTTVERMIVAAATEDEPAQTVYRAREADSPAAEPPSINYMLAMRIEILLRDGQVSSVRAEGPVQGLQLQPMTTGNGVPADTTSRRPGRGSR